MSAVVTTRDFRWDSVTELGRRVVAVVEGHNVLANGNGLFDGIRMPEVARVQINLRNNGGTFATPQLFCKAYPSFVTLASGINHHLIETQDPMAGAVRYDLNSAAFLADQNQQTLIVSEGIHHASTTMERSYIWYQDELSMQLSSVDAGETLVLDMALIITDMRSVFGL